MFYVAADAHDARETLRQRCAGCIIFPSSSSSSRVDCENEFARQTKCMQFALAELLILSQTKSFVYSTESSFSEVIVKMGDFAESFSGCAD